ncbi:phosphoribosyltransferase [Trinickia sp. LjRoot230]|uniref:phosphoribosyltransferase n=1 Tax=Trinickia sp. LjRoot230 TaxID=3342288 RepID=UPI003ECF6F42
MMHALFKDRAEAGRMLAERLKDYRSPDTVVLALPRGGVPVAFELAAALGAKLDVLLVRKLGVPGQPELAMGAIASAGAQFVDRDIVRSAHVSQAQFESVLAQQTAELARQEKLYHADNTSLEVESKTVIVVDDGIATGATMQAAAHALRERHPAHVIVAVPVAPAGVQAAFEDIVDEFVCVAQPTLFLSVGQHYDEFAQTSDGEVLDLLSRSRRQ